MLSRQTQQQGCAVRHSSSCQAKQRRHCLLWRQQQQMVTPIWLTLLLLVHALVPCIHAVPVDNTQQSQQILQRHWHNNAGQTAADVDADPLSTSAASPAAAPSPWESFRDQAQQRRQQFKQHVYQQQQLLAPRSAQQQQQEEHLVQLPFTLHDSSFRITDSKHNLKPTVGTRINIAHRNTHLDSPAVADTAQGTVVTSASHSNTAAGPATDTTVVRHSAAPAADAIPWTLYPITGSDFASGHSVDMLNGLTVDAGTSLTTDAPLLGDSAAVADAVPDHTIPSTHITSSITHPATMLSAVKEDAAIAVTETPRPIQTVPAAAEMLEHDIKAAAGDNAAFGQADMTQTVSASQSQQTNLQHPAAGMLFHHQWQLQQQQQNQQQSSSDAAVQRSDTPKRSAITAATPALAAGLPAVDLYRLDSLDVEDGRVEFADRSTSSMQGSRSSFATANPTPRVQAATTAAAADGTVGRSLTDAAAATTLQQQQQQPLRPSAVSAEQLVGPASPPSVIADLSAAEKAAAVPATAAVVATPAADLPLDSLAHPHAGTAAAAGPTLLAALDGPTAVGSGTTVAAVPTAPPAIGPVSSIDHAAATGVPIEAATAAAGAPLAAAGVPTTAAAAAGAVEVGGSSISSVASSSAWKPQVLDAPVPKWPRLYSTVAPPAPTLTAAARPAAVQALLSAAAAARTPQGISISGIPGLSLEDKILLARLLGHVVSGTFDDLGQMDPANTAYWEQLDAQVEKHTQVKHMFESIWYKCSKLNADLLMRASTAYDMEIEALQHILAWLGVPERHLPRPGEFANFDDLVTLLDGIGAKARLVTDPVPFLATTRPPLDRNGMPLLIHMTFKDKGQFARHHLLSLASWAKENPDHAILMYDDADLEAYLSTYDPSVLELYSSLKTAVERSDLWRYVVMCKHGGVYTDADTLCVRPIQEWNSENHNDAEALFGVEDVFKRDPHRGNSGWGVSMGRFGIQFEQWTLAGAANHPVYCNMHSFISQRMKDEASKLSPVSTTDSENWSILHRTGPHVWTDSVLKWMHDQGIGFHEALVPGGRLVSNNTRIMPGETFGCAAHFFSPAARLEEVYAMHMFRGVWRKRLDSGGAEAARRDLRLGF